MFPSLSMLAPNSRALPPTSPNREHVLPPSKSAPTNSPPKSNKKRRFRGWVCEDELSDDEAMLREKLESQGREFRVVPNIPSSKSATAAAQLSSGTRKNLTPRLQDAATSESDTTPPPKPKSKIASPNSQQTSTKIKRASNKRKAAALTSKKAASKIKVASSRTSKKPRRTLAEAPNMVRNKDTQPPKKKRRFRGYVCEDEVEEEDAALADVIRQKGTLFKVKEAAAAKETSTGNLVGVEEDIDDTPQSPESDDPISQPIQARVATARSKATKRQSAPAKLPPNSPTKQSPNLEPPSTPLDRAQINVKAATQSAKRFQFIADEAAKAAAIAKRRAMDAANKLEEAKRLLRTESEKKKALSSGLRYHPGYAWEEVDGSSEEQEDDGMEKDKQGQQEEDGEENEKRKVINRITVGGSAPVDDSDEDTDLSTDDDDSDEDDDDDEDMTETESESDSVGGQTKDLLG